MGTAKNPSRRPGWAEDSTRYWRSSHLGIRSSGLFESLGNHFSAFAQLNDRGVPWLVTPLWLTLEFSVCLVIQRPAMIGRLITGVLGTVLFGYGVYWGETYLAGFGIVLALTSVGTLLDREIF